MKQTCASESLGSSTKGNCPQKRFNVNVRVVDGEIVVLDRQHGKVHKLNETATFVWGRCDGRSTVAKIADQYCKTFDVNPETAARDALAIVAQLQKLNLLEPGFNSVLSVA